MVIHRNGSTAPTAARPALAENDRRKGRKRRKLNVAAARGRQCQQSGTVKEAKTGSGNCGKCGN